VRSGNRPPNGSSAALDLPHNPELAALQAGHIPCLSFAEYLGDYSVGRETCVVAGSFGKSTLTAMLAVLMRAAGRDPGYFIGAVPLDLPTTGYAGADPQFLLEGDEYIVSPEDRRSKFLLYKAHALLLSSLVHDHFNAFPTPQSYEAPFAELIVTARRQMAARADCDRTLARSYGHFDALLVGTEVGLLVDKTPETTAAV